MSAKKGRRVTAAKGKSQKGSDVGDMSSPNLSVIDKVSFMVGLQQNFGNFLHSTALEEDLNPVERQTDKGKAASKTFVKQYGGTGKRKKTEKDAEDGEEDEKRKKSRKSAGGNDRAGKGKKQQVKKEKKKESKKSNEPRPQDESDAESVPQTQRPVLPSDEEGEGDDYTWKPSPTKARKFSLSKARKSSSDRVKSTTPSPEVPDRKIRPAEGGASEEEGEEDEEKRRKKKISRRGGTEMEVVLDAFTAFCGQYRETVESKAVRQSIDSFSTSVKQQLMEKISSDRNLRVLQRENKKVASSIRKKTQKLLEAKQERMRAERQLTLLRKEEAELALRLADLRRGQAFLHDLREVNRLYLDFRHKNPEEKETYGASSDPALVLEKKITQRAEQNQRGKEDVTEKRRRRR